MTKTVSARISNKNHEELRERCNQLGCNINEFVGECVKFMLFNESDFQFEPEDDEPSEVEPEPAKQKRPEPKIFDCSDGNLYHNGNLFGKCIDYQMKSGKVYDDSGQYLGQTKDSLKATVTLIE